ncbi:MAG: hypothetical protein ACI3Y5_06235 [Prevotella sp.]
MDNFTQFSKCGSRGEQCCGQAFNRVRAKSVNWLRFNICLAKRYLGDEGGLKAIAIGPSYISKLVKQTTHIGRFWSGRAGAVKHGLEVMGIGLIDISKSNYIMLRARQTPNSTELNVRIKSQIQHYIGVVKRYGKELIGHRFLDNNPYTVTLKIWTKVKDIEHTAVTYLNDSDSSTARGHWRRWFNT